MKALRNQLSINAHKFLNTTVFVVLFFLTYTANAGKEKIEYLMTLEPERVERFSAKNGANKGFVRMEFGTSKVLGARSFYKYRGQQVTNIKLVYTTYKESSTFDQPELNRERFTKLYKMAPEIFDNPLIHWEVIAQTGKDKEDAKKYFHGFEVSFRPIATKGTTVTEMKMIMSVLDNEDLGRDSISYDTIQKIRERKKFTGYYLGKSGKKYGKRGVWDRRREYESYLDTSYRVKKVVHFIPSKKKISYLSLGLVDSTIFKILERNDDWTDISFVCDVTGSMGMYTSQLVIWNKLNYHTHRAKYYTFFNDGDTKPQYKKKIGNTGGIYSLKPTNVDDMEKTMYMAMTAGYGGDGPENDIEALKESLKKCSDAKEIVLVADNWSPVRDIKLIEDLKIPVRVILCGSFKGVVNTQYLDLAFKTGGSIHTIEEDIENLVKISDGDVIKIGESSYRILNGKFYPVYSL